MCEGELIPFVLLQVKGNKVWATQLALYGFILKLISFINLTN